MNNKITKIVSIIQYIILGIACFALLTEHINIAVAGIILYLVSDYINKGGN